MLEDELVEDDEAEAPLSAAAAPAGEACVEAAASEEIFFVELLLVAEVEELLEEEAASVPSGLSGLLESSSGRTSSAGMSGFSVKPEKLEYIDT